MSNTHSDPYPETADIETASDEYAARFAGKTGEWFLRAQAAAVRSALKDLPPNATVWDIGGGHAQTAPVALAAGHRVTVTGSAPVCANRLPEGLSFREANHLELPLEDRGVDAVLCFRLLPHCDRWPELVRELCRVADRKVIVDYPTRQSLNAAAEVMFGMKKKIEKNTRPFTLFSHRDIREAFEAEGFRIRARHPQFFWPMVLHRMLKCPAVSGALEAPCRWTGLSRLLGSPVVIDAERVS